MEEERKGMGEGQRGGIFGGGGGTELIDQCKYIILYSI